MPTISYLVEEYINEHPLIQEAVIEDIASYAAVAEKISPAIKSKIKREISHQAVVMAIRRYAEKIERKNKFKKEPPKEIIMKTNLMDIIVTKSHSIFSKLKKIYDAVDYEKGDTLNIIHGNYEIAIVISDRYKERILETLKEERIILVRDGLVALSIRFSNPYIEVPGVIAKYTRKIAWENINIIEIISTNIELTFIIQKKDASKAYEALLD